MNGNRILLDTNAVITLINEDEKILPLVSQAEFVAISIVTALEFLSFPHLSQKDKNLFEDFCTEVALIDIAFANTSLVREITSLRQNNKIKLPDAVVAASAIIYNCVLITKDEAFKRIINLSTKTF